MVGRRAKRETALAPPQARPNALDHGGQHSGEDSSKEGRGREHPEEELQCPQTPPKETPRPAAVALSIRDGAKMSYAGTMSSASRIDLAELGIPEVRPKRAINGGLLLEIPGRRVLPGLMPLPAK